MRPIVGGRRSDRLAAVAPSLFSGRLLSRPFQAFSLDRALVSLSGPLVLLNASRKELEGPGDEPNVVLGRLPKPGPV